MKSSHRFASVALLGVVFSPSIWAQNPPSATDVPALRLTIAHTNDLHSHFRPEKTLLGLGGVARIKTAVDRLRAQSEAMLFLDGGDWSEGHIYYTQGAGRETLKMMDALGYDAAVVGNHDWLNGPDVLLDAVLDTRPRMALVSANLGVEKYSRGAEFKRAIPPYVIREVGGKNGAPTARVALIGISTHQYIFDSFVKPVTVQPLSAAVRAAVQEIQALPQKVSAIVVISHNKIGDNETVLREVPEVDLIVGAHDHVKLVVPRKVTRNGAPDGWIVETGAWGRNLGTVEMTLFPEGVQRPQLQSYRLLQMDAKIPPSKDILKEIARLEAEIEKRMGPVFSRELAKAKISLDREGLESRMGNFAVDTFREALGADLSLDVTNFIYSELHAGSVKEADAFNALPGVYNPATKKTWTLHTLPMTGHTLKWVTNLLFSSRKFTELGLLNLSGAEIVYSPAFKAQKTGLFVTDALGEKIFPDPSINGTVDTQNIIKSLRVGGKTVSDSDTYTVAINGGLVETLEFLHDRLGNFLPMDGLKDSTREAWRVLAERLSKLKTIDAPQAPIGGRLVSWSPDLGVIDDEIEVDPRRIDDTTVQTHVRAPIRNFGANTYVPAGAQASLWINRWGNDYARESEWIQIGEAQTVQELAAGATQWMSWDAQLPIDDGLCHFWVRLTYPNNGKNSGDINPTNNTAARWFNAPLILGEL